jgi:hypothetical protein
MQEMSFAFRTGIRHLIDFFAVKFDFLEVHIKWQSGYQQSTGSPCLCQTKM